ncbi:MAG: ribosomal protein S18-alanine N-acetyltransferase [Halioglobus sp.]
MSGSIRAALPQDTHILWSIDSQASAYPWREEQFSAACAREEASERALLIEISGQVVGFIVYCRVLDSGDIHNIAVSPHYQRRGLARDLLVSALDAMAVKGVTRCFLEVRRSNLAAQGLYSSMGFQVEGQRKNYYRQGAEREDALLMSKRL